MSSSTSTLELFKYDTSTDGKEVFSINTALNANWDKIDSFASAIKSLSNLDAQGEKRFTDIQNSLANKLEADVLLEENGYIKFNSGMMICGGRLWTNVTTYNFPVAFQNRVIGIAFSQTGASSNSVVRVSFKSIPTVTGFVIDYARDNMMNKGAYYIALGN